jgi:tetratricopeptide (TPR) repeat protein
MATIENLETMLRRGQDTPLLRYGLGSEYLKEGYPERAAEHLAQAVSQEPGYSAAWKLYGKALTVAARYGEAIEVFDRGIAAAEEKGDIQAAKEMGVFRKRAVKALAEAGG